MPPLPATDLKALQEQNRAALVEAIKRRNDLHVEVQRLEQRTATLEREATEALRDGNRGTAKLRLQAKVAAEQELGARRGELASVESNVEDIKRSIRDTEELLRIQPPEAAKQVVTVEGTSSAVPLTLRDTLASGDHGQPIATDTAADTMGADVLQMDNDFGPRSNTPTPDLSALSPTFLPPVPSEEPPPKMDALIAARAQERGLTPEEYTSSLNERLTALAEFMLPVGKLEADGNDGERNFVEATLYDVMRELQDKMIQLREYAVNIITHKNNLMSEVAKQKRIDEEYSRKALQSFDQGNRELARQFYREKRRHEQSLPVMQTLLAQANEAAEQVKERVMREEERMRIRTSKAMLLEVNMRAALMQFRLDTLQENTGLPEITEDDFDAWIHAQQSASPE